jgi:hypothetical protein
VKDDDVCVPIEEKNEYEIKHIKSMINTKGNYVVYIMGLCGGVQIGKNDVVINTILGKE